MAEVSTDSMIDRRIPHLTAHHTDRRASISTSSPSTELLATTLDAQPHEDELMRGRIENVTPRKRSNAGTVGLVCVA